MAQSKRRWVIGLLAALAFLTAAEFSLRHWKRPKACVQIVNKGNQSIDGLVLDYDGGKVLVGRVPAGRSVRAWLTAGPAGPLRLNFQQKGNPLQGFVIPNFDPMQSVADGLKMVLVIQPNQVNQFMDDDESRSGPGWMERFEDWLRDQYRAQSPP